MNNEHFVAPKSVIRVFFVVYTNFVFVKLKMKFCRFDNKKIFLRICNVSISCETLSSKEEVKKYFGVHSMRYKRLFHLQYPIFANYFYSPTGVTQTLKHF